MGKKRNSNKKSRTSRAAGSAASSQPIRAHGSHVAPEFLAPCVVLWVLLALLVLLQGGYYADTASLVGAVGCVAALACAGVTLYQRRVYGLELSLSPLSLAALACCVAVLLLVLASMLANACNVTALTAVGRYGLLTGLLASCLLVRSHDRELVVRGVCWVGVGCAAAFLLLYAGAVPYEGAAEGTRLQGTFQYANTCGAFMAAVALLCVSSDSRALARLATLPLACALLTQSGGALVAAGLCALGWVAVRLVRDDEGASRAVALLVQGAAALVAALVALRANPVAGAVAAAVLAAGAYVLLGASPLLQLFRDTPEKRLRTIVAVAVGVVAIGCVVCMAVLFPGRIAQAQSTFVERGIQIRDGLALLAANLGLGVGPDQWQFAYPLVQSAQYRAAYIHCSYVQVALDGGAIAGLAWVAVVVLGVVRCARLRERGACAVAVLLAAHMLVDFDLQFTAYALLFMVVAFVPAQGDEAVESTRACGAGGRQTAALLAVVACLAVGLVGAGACCAGGFAHADMRRAAEVGDAQAAQRMVADNALLANDPADQALYLQALCDGGDYETAAKWAREHDVAYDQTALYAAKAHYETGDAQAAARLLVDQLAAQPGNEAFFRMAAKVFEAYGLPASQRSAYEAAVAQANELIAREPACLLANQKAVEAA